MCAGLVVGWDDARGDSVNFSGLFRSEELEFSWSNGMRRLVCVVRGRESSGPVRGYPGGRDGTYTMEKKSSAGANALQVRIPLNCLLNIMVFRKSGQGKTRVLRVVKVECSNQNGRHTLENVGGRQPRQVPLANSILDSGVRWLLVWRRLRRPRGWLGRQRGWSDPAGDTARRCRRSRLCLGRPPR